MMGIARFREYHMVHDLAARSHSDGLLGLHVMVMRSTMGCPACAGLTSQLSPLNDYMTGISYDGPHDHIDRNELSTTGIYCCRLDIIMFFKVVVLATFGREKGLLKSSISSVAYSGFGVWCQNYFKGLEVCS